MGIVFRQSVKTTIAVFAGAALGAAATLIGPKCLPMAELGFSRNFVNQAAVLQFITLLGFHFVLVTYVPRYATHDPRRRAILTASLAAPVIAVLLLLLPYFGLEDWVIGKFQARDQPFLRRFYGWLPVLVILWSLTSMLDSYLNTEKKIALSAFVREVVTKGGTLLLLALVGLQVIPFPVFMGATVGLYALPLGILLSVAARSAGFGLTSNLRVIPGREWREIFRFAWYHLLTSISLNLVGLVDALMLAPLDRNGFASIAVYTTATFIASMLVIPYRAMATSAFPILNEAFIAGDNAKVADLYHRSGINIAIAAVALSALIAPNLQSLIKLLPQGYEAVAPLVLILIVGRLTDALTGMNGEIIGISPHYKFLFRISALLLVVLIASNRLLIPRFGMYGAAWSSALSLAAFNVGKMIFLWLRFRLQPFSRQTLFVLLAGGIAAFAGWMMPDIGPPIVAMMLRGAVIVVAYVALLLWWKPSPDLRDYLASIRKNKRLF